MSSEKLCKNCEYYIFNPSSIYHVAPGPLHICSRLKKQSMVDGDTIINTLDCDVERLEGECSEDAKFFKQKKHKPKTLLEKVFDVFRF